MRNERSDQWATAERFLALSRVATAIMSELDGERLLHLIARTACDLTGASFAAFSLRPIDDEGQFQGPAEGSLFHLAAVIGVTPEQEALFRRMPLGGEGLLAPIFRHGVPVLVADVLARLPDASDSVASGLSDAKEAAREAALAFVQGRLPTQALPSLGLPFGHPPVRSFLGAPLLDRSGEVRGGLLLGHADPDQFTEEDQTLLLILAGQAAVALENFRLFHQAQVRALELQATFDSISEGVTLVDHQGRVRRENAAARQVRRTVLDSPQAQQLLEALLTAPAQSVLTGSEAGSRVVQVSDEAGEQRDYLVTAHLLRPPTTRSGPLSQDTSPRSPNEEHLLAQAVVIWHDVTERRMREVALQAQERTSYLEAIFEAMVDGVYVFDQQGRIVQMNAAARMRLARTLPQGAAARSLDERFEETTVATVEGQRLTLEQVPTARFLQGEQLTPEHAMELQLPTLDDAVLYTSTTGGPIRDADGHIIGAVAISRDVTERRQLEQRLHTSEREARERAAQLETIFETIPDAIVIADASGRMVQFNTAARALLGLQDRSDVFLLSLEERGKALQVRSEDGQPHPNEQLSHARIMRGETILPTNPSITLLRSLDGYRRYISTTGAPLYDEDGHISGVVTVTRDITQQKQAERAREQQAQQLRLQSSLIELAHDAILVRDPISRILSWNRGAEALYGWTEQEALGRVSHQLLKTHFPTSRAAVEALLESEGRWEGELLYTHRDGSVVIVESRQVLMRDERGAPTAILEINRNITQRRKLEQAQTAAHIETLAQRTFLQQLLDALPSGIFLVHGREARLVLANQGAASIWGAEWSPGRPMRAFLEEHSISIVDAQEHAVPPEAWATMRALLTGETVLQHQEIIRQPGGTSLPLLVNAVPLTSPHWRSLGMPDEPESSPSQNSEPLALVIHQDVRRLKEAEYAKDEFIGIAAHELRQPLSVLKGTVGTLLLQTARGHGPALASWQQEMLDDLDEATDRLIRLIDDLLDASYLQAGQLILHRASTDLVSLGQRLVKRFQKTTTLHQLVFDTEHPKLEAMIDPQRIEQVLSNLLTNAIKYSPQGGPVCVMLTIPTGTQEVEIRVQDEGLGIPRHQQARIFGRFSRADNAQAAGISGTGLGLYLCRALVEQHEGRIWFVSEEGEGTTFFVRLPLVAPVLNK